MLLFLELMVCIPVSAAHAYDGRSGLATPLVGTAQGTPTVDLTVTALAKEQLMLQVKQLQNQLQDQNNWFANNSTALIAAVAAVIVALFGILQWAITIRQAQDKDRKDREDERQKEIAAQDKDLRAQAEERFKTAVIALGDENESTQVGGAILLRSFLHKDDEKIYGRYYTQIFDLAVAYLRLPRTSQAPQDVDTPLPLTSLRQVLVVVFKEVFPLARSQNRGRIQSLDATAVQLDSGNLREADLQHAWMRHASIRDADLIDATLISARLFKADLRQAWLWRADLRETDLRGADLRETNLRETDFRGANLREVDLRGADLKASNLSKADLREANLDWSSFEEVLSLEDTNLLSVKGLTKEQLEACKAKGAIIDGDATTSPPQSSVSPPATS